MRRVTFKIKGTQHVFAAYHQRVVMGACSCQACLLKEKNNYLGQILMGIRLITIAKEVMNK
jgi:hypothetical protein